MFSPHAAGGARLAQPARGAQCVQRQVIAALTATFAELSQDKELRVVVLGAHGKPFVLGPISTG